MNIGQFNQLRVTKEVPFGIYLDGDGYGEILLPKRYVPEGTQIDDELDVFIYVDSEDRLIATTETPKAVVGECAYLKVVDVNHVGAFLDWGLPKDLLVPRNEQDQRMVEGESYVVYVFEDERDQAIAATSKLDRYLHEMSVYFKPQQAVDLMICKKTDLGYKAVINNTHLGLIYANEVFQPLSMGQKIQGYIKHIRDDKMIDLTLRIAAKETHDQLTEKLLQHMRDNGGKSLFHDKSPADEIYREFHVSKKQFKRTLGGLYKKKLIVIDENTHQIRLK